MEFKFFSLRLPSRSGGVSFSRKKRIDFGARIKEDQAMMLDLLNIITYMSSIATSDIDRAKIIELASQQDGITARYLDKVRLLAENYGYDYADACKTVAENVKHPELKDFLIRLSNALATGEDEEKFLRIEAEQIVEKYTNKYLSDVDTLRKWTDGYTALLVSVTMVIAIFLISSMLFKMGDVGVMGFLAGVLLCFVCFLGVYIIYRVSPYEKTVHSLDVRSKEQDILHGISRFLLPAVFVVPLAIFMAGMDEWMVFLAVSLLLAPMGIIAIIDARNIERRDRDLSSFLKSLGAAAGITGTTLAVAISRLDKKSVGTLEKFVRKLYKRLIHGINPHVCWHYFAGETGSELVNRYTRVFLDAVELGGDPMKIGEVVSNSVLGVSLLRAKRKLVANGFVNLVIPLHVTMCGLIMFIYEMLYTFNSALLRLYQEHGEDIRKGMEHISTGGLGFFNISNASDIEFFSKYVIFVILVLTLANAFASKYAAGGSNYKICFYAFILFMLSAFIIYVMPIVSSVFFVPFTGP